MTEGKGYWPGDMHISNDIAYDENTIFFRCKGCDKLGIYYPTAVGKAVAGAVAHEKPSSMIGVPNATGCQLFMNSTPRNYWRAHRNVKKMMNPKAKAPEKKEEMLSSMSNEDQGKLIGFIHVMHKDMMEGGVKGFSFGIHGTLGCRVGVLYDEGSVTGEGKTIAGAIQDMSEKMIKEGMKGAAEA